MTGLLVITVVNPETVIGAQRQPFFLRALGHQIQSETIGTIATIGCTIELFDQGVAPERDGLTIMFPYVREAIRTDSDNGVIMYGAMERDVDFVNGVAAIDGCQFVKVSTLIG